MGSLWVDMIRVALNRKSVVLLGILSNILFCGMGWLQDSTWVKEVVPLPDVTVFETFRML